MTKKTSSASAGTRKKNARKAAKGGAGEDLDESVPQHTQKTQQGKNKKLSKAQKRALPKAKRYVPPPKPPAPPIPNPLDSQGLAGQLPAELVVALRGLGKKDDVTRRKALEELKDVWVAGVIKGEGDEVEKEVREAALVSSTPVWLHNLASLLQSPFHRTMALQLHEDLLTIPSIRHIILETLSLSLLPGTQNRDILGAWLVTSLDEGRRSGMDSKKRDESTIWLESVDELATEDGKINLTAQLPYLVEYLSLSVLDPPSLHDDIHPSPVSTAFQKAAPTKAKKKAFVAPTAAPEVDTEDEQIAEERWTRYRLGGFVGLSWLLTQLSTHNVPLPEELLALLGNSYLWTALSPTIGEEGDETLGGRQPVIRRAAYELLSTLVNRYPAEVKRKEMLDMLSTAVLESCWIEREAAVWQTAGPAIAHFLGKNKEAWQIAFEAQPAVEAAPAKGDENENGADETNEDDEDEDNDDDEDEDGDDGEEDDDMSKPDTTPADVPASTKPRSAAFVQFLDFVSSICPTIPDSTYPFLLMFIATIPPSILSLTSPPSLELQTLFAHLWSPADARLLSTHSLPNRLSAYTTFIQHLIDNTGLLMSRAWRSEESKETAFWLAEEQMGKRVWVEGILEMGGRSGRRGGEQKGKEVEADFFGKEVAKMENLSPELVEKMVSVMREPTLDACFPSQEGKTNDAALSRLQGVVTIAGQSPKFKAALVEILTDVTTRSVQEFKSTASQREPERNQALTTYLEDVLSSTPEAFTDQTRSDLLSTMDSSLTTLLMHSQSPSSSVGLISALSTQNKESSTLQDTLWRVLEDTSNTLEKRCDFATELLQGGQSKTLLKEGVLDHLALESTQALLNNQSPDGESPKVRSFLSTCMGSTSRISKATVQEILALLSTAITHMVNESLTRLDRDVHLYPAIEVLYAYGKHDLQTLVSSDIYLPALVSVHHAATIFGDIGLSVPGTANAFGGIGLTVDGTAKAFGDLCRGSPQVVEAVLSSLSALLNSTENVVPPQVLFDTASELPGSKPDTVLAKLLPARGELINRLSELAALSPEVGLSIMDALIPISKGSSSAPSNSYDTEGRSALARCNEAVLSLFRANRESVHDSNLLWLVLSSSELAKEASWGTTQGCSRGMYAHSTHSTNKADLDQVVQEAERALMLVLMKSDEVDWHKKTIEGIKSKTEPTVTDTTSRVLVQLGQIEVKDDVSCRVFRKVLGQYTRQNDTTPADGEAWLNLAMTVSDSQPNFAIAIISAIQPFMQDTPAYEKLQNRWANAILGIRPENATTKGITTLRLLVSTAPDPETSSILLPPHRARFVIQHLGSWQDYLYQEEDMDNELFVWIGEAYNIIAPVIQSESGGLWAKIFDFMEDTLDEVTLEDRLPLVNTSLKLVQHVISLTSSNKGLLAQWENQEKVKSSVLELFTQCQGGSQAADEHSSISAPLDQIHTSILNILPEVDDEAMAKISLSKLANLLNLATPPDIQSAAYGIMRTAIQANMFAMVVECEAWTDKGEDGLPVKDVLSPSLLEIVERGRYIDWEQQTNISMVLSQLLSWLAILDHFESASRPLRWAALDQLNPTQVDASGPKMPNLVEEALMPMLFAMFGVSEVGAWNFPASQYRVDEFMFQYLEAETMADLTPLASYLFYRALVTIPASMRQYYESLKNRQLSLSMLNYVALHYSPVIIANEFASLREPYAMATLTEEGLNIKIVQGGGATVAGASSSEVIAGYIVDEQPMEIGIRLPAEFPLKGVQIRDLRRAGVPENKWRGWLMSVQQTITSRNGLILEALTVFKKNLSLHFEGVVECSICYSIISLTDRTLPTKPCSRCHNRFHASCLFKWFNSSHTSSCPLCRELF